MKPDAMNRKGAWFDCVASPLRALGPGNSLAQGLGPPQSRVERALKSRYRKVSALRCRRELLRLQEAVSVFRDRCAEPEFKFPDPGACLCRVRRFPPGRIQDSSSIPDLPAPRVRDAARVLRLRWPLAEPSPPRSEAGTAGDLSATLSPASYHRKSRELSQLCISLRAPCLRPVNETILAFKS